MSLRDRLRRLLCPTCIHEARGSERRANTVQILERSSVALDRMIADLRAVPRRVSDGHNPLLPPDEEPR
jgi:hypothetical protein